MHAALRVEHGVQFVDHHASDAGEETRDLAPASHEHRFERLRRDQEHAPGIADRTGLGGSGHVTVPLVNWDLECLAKLVQPPELVVDQRLERTDVDELETRAAGIASHDPREQRHERRLGLARRGRSGDHEIPVALQQQRDRALLNVAKLGPAALPDPLLHRPGEQPEFRRLADPGASGVRE